MKYVSVDFKQEMEERLKDSDRLVFLLSLLKSGKYELSTGVYGGGHRTVCYQETLELIKKDKYLFHQPIDSKAN